MRKFIASIRSGVAAMTSTVARQISRKPNGESYFFEDLERAAAKQRHYGEGS